MDSNFKCPLCATYFDTHEELSEHVKAKHTSYYYDTFMMQPVQNFAEESRAVLGTETSATVVTTEPVSTVDEPNEPASTQNNDGCDECDCCDCFGGDTGPDSGGHDAGGYDDGDGDCD